MTRRTSQSMRRSVGDLRVCRVRSDLAEALSLRVRRQQQAPKLGRPRLRRSVQRRTRPATRQQAHVRQRLRDARGYRSAQSFGRSLWAFRTSTTSRSSRRFAPRSRRERPLHGRRPILEGSEGPPRGGRTLQYSPNRCPASINASTGPSCGASTDVRVAELAHYPAHRYACCRGANMSRLEVGGAVGGARDPQWGQGGRGPRCAC